MLISYRWLGRHVDLDGLTPDEVAEKLTLHTAEVEGVEPFAPWLSEVVVGHVVTRERHPDADKLSLCTVDLGAAGDGKPTQIVCGAKNVDAGQRVAVARVGTTLPGDVKIKKSKIRGVESRGMICSVKELELGDDHSGIWVLPEDAALGEPVARALGVEDTVIEIDNKSLTHRPDLWGHRGIAGEVAALFGRSLSPLDLALPKAGKGAPYPVRVESEGCSRYLGIAVDGVKNGPAPEWMRFLLLAVGQRPLDLLVDLSNFVMLDLGQPNHLFDRRRLSPEGIHVRDARPGEKLVTLDEVERELTPEDVLICSGDTPVALAGVMGGDASKVEADTTEILLEAAAFHPTRIRRTAARLGMRTDASARFEKSLDPTLPAKAAAHLLNVLRELQPDVRIACPPGDDGSWSDPACTVSLRPERVRAVLGAAIEDDEIERILTSLHFGITRGRKAPWKVAVPSERATKDVGIEDDLIEEVGRVHGYDRIAERPLLAELRPPPRDPRRRLVRTLQDRLAGAAGFHEALTYSFQADDLLERLHLAGEPHVQVVNPLVEGQAKIRRDVLPSLLGLLAQNRRHREDVRLFEVGKGYRPEEANERGEPRELHQLALVWAVPRPGAGARFDAARVHHVQALVEDLVRAAGAPALAWQAGTPAQAPTWAHPAKLLIAPGPDGTPLARVAELEPALARELGLAGELASDVAAAELSLDLLLELPRSPRAHRPVPRFPGIKVDVALAVPEATPAADVLAAIEKASKGLCAGTELFDVYRGESVGEGRKSLAFHVLLQAEGRTLTEADEAKFLDRLERGAGEVGGELRRS